MYGELVPVGGGDTIPLLKKSLLVGRRESCDIVLRFPNVSAHHCQLTLMGGYWYVRDLQSRNGVKVNSVKVTEKRLDPGDTLAVAKHFYEVHYSPGDLGAVGPPPAEAGAAISEVFSKSLLERAGLTKDVDVPDERADRDLRKRYDVTNNDARQLRDRNRPV
jgi:adenylate cyclase